MMLGAIAGVIAGFVSEDGLLQGTLIGAISGAFIAMEVVDSLAKIWCYEEYSIATRAHLMVSYLRVSCQKKNVHRHGCRLTDLLRSSAACVLESCD
jgi:uncharacterized membrane protein YeaQ/YmgE (transglycosylase-associated protein family)